MERLTEAAVRAMDEYFSLCKHAEQHRDEDFHAAVVLQSCWRGVLQRKELLKLRDVALTIQKCWRGYLGRRRFAAAKAAHNKQLREAYFARQATIIQSCWRGYFSRSRLHDFHKRKAYLAAVAAANAAVKADTEAQLADALRLQQQQLEQVAKQRFQSQVCRLNHLTSTACTPGIFNSPAAVVTGSLPVVAGLPLEQHLKAASKQQAAAAVKRQQQTLQNAAAASGFAWPAGSPVKAASYRAGMHAVQGMQQECGTVCNSHIVPPCQKLSSLLVAAVDDAFAVRAAPNMPDGSFNPALTLQQSAEFDAARQATELERRIDRGVMLALHSGQPFVTASTKTHHCQLPSGSCLGDCNTTSPALVPQAAQSVGSTTHWQHNSHTGGFFSKHLKQHY